MWQGVRVMWPFYHRAGQSISGNLIQCGVVHYGQTFPLWFPKSFGEMLKRLIFPGNLSKYACFSLFYFKFAVPNISP